MKKILFFIIALLQLLYFTQCSVKYSDVLMLSDNEEGIAIESIETPSAFTQGFLIWVEQPLDHRNPSLGTFNQRVWLSHIDESSPVVMVTEGYLVPENYISELASILNANQIIVEHRFFGASGSDSINWEYLNSYQAAHDHQRIIDVFSKLYRDKWVTTGISKGGQAAVIHRAYFPKAVDATLTYVAPFNVEREDQRIIDFLDSVGTPQIRGRIFNFQKEVLSRRDEILPLFIDFSEDRELTYPMGYEMAFELSVLEYPFSFWQWCVPEEEIPEVDASSNELLQHLYRGVDFSYFSAQESELIGPFFYQAYSELGYYGYIASPFLEHLRILNSHTVSSDVLIPERYQLVEFDAGVSASIIKRLHRSDPQMLHIIGGNDPWSATSLNVSGLKNSYKLKWDEGCHYTRINNLPDSLKKEVEQILADWGFQL